MKTTKTTYNNLFRKFMIGFLLLFSGIGISSFAGATEAFAQNEDNVIFCGDEVEEIDIRSGGSSTVGGGQNGLDVAKCSIQNFFANRVINTIGNFLGTILFLLGIYALAQNWLWVKNAGGKTLHFLDDEKLKKGASTLEVIKRSTGTYFGIGGMIILFPNIITTGFFLLITSARNLIELILNQIPSF